MPKDEQSKEKVGRGWRPPESFNPDKYFKPRRAHRHISKVEPADGTRGERIRLFINKPLTEAEKVLFGQLLVKDHREWFGCACWSHGDLAVRISIKTRNVEVLTTARMEVARHVDQVLATIFTNRSSKR